MYWAEAVDAKCTRLACLLSFASLFSPLAVCLLANTEKKEFNRGWSTIIVFLLHDVEDVC